MRDCPRPLLPVLLALVVALPGLASGKPVRSGKAEAELVSNLASIQPGKSFTLAIRLKTDPHWHSYWANPGDAGSPTKVKWDLPEGFQVGALEFPVPKRFEAAGLVGYGYDGEVLLLTTVTAPQDLKDGEITLMATVSWLACDATQCLPGSADLELPLAVKNQQVASAKWAAPIGRTLQTIPRSLPDAKATIVQDGGEWRITLQLPKDWQGFPSSPGFFVENEDFAKLTPAPKIAEVEGGIEIRVPVAEYAEELKNPVRFVFSGLRRPLLFSATAPALEPRAKVSP